jgi:DnaJ-like protein
MSHPDAEREYYSILGAGETASQDEIERLYKRLARRHHPDRGGDAEEMKAINEAYRVLGNAATRRAYDGNAATRRAYDENAASRSYDSRHQRGDDALSAVDDAVNAVGAPLSPPSELLPDTVPGRLVGALFFLLAGLVFLFLVRIYYIRFMWPIFLIAAFVVIFGVWKVHRVMVFARKSVAPSHPVRRYVWIQELAFWSMVCAGAYGIYLLMSAI